MFPKDQCLLEPVRLSVPDYLMKPPPHTYEPEGIVVVDVAVLVVYIVDIVVLLVVSVVVVVVPIYVVVDHVVVVVVVSVVVVVVPIYVVVPGSWSERSLSAER